MASNYQDDWQSSKNTVLQRNAYMLDNELMSDVSFTCGESSRIFHAHKYVLATSSAAFYAMFYGDLVQEEFPIRLPDTDEESFKEFMRYLYTDDCKITAENAIGVMYLAKKYLVSSLVEKCCTALEEWIEPENVFMVLEQAVQFDEQTLEAKCWDIVSKKTQECINLEAFCNVGSHTLNVLLKSETLTVTAVELFKAVLKWIDSECVRQSINIEDDKTARRRVLGDSVYEISFLEMSKEDFAKYVSSTGILTEAELVSIFQKLNGLDVADLKWKEQKKCRSCIVGFSRFDVGDTSVSGNWKGLSSHALTLTVNKAVLFHGVRLFGDAKGSQYKVEFTIKDENVKWTYTSEQDIDDVWGYDVMLPKPVPIQPDEKFTLVATINGPPSHRGRNGKPSVKVDDVVVTFNDASNLEAELVPIFQKLNGLDVAGLKWKEQKKRRLCFSRFDVANILRGNSNYKGTSNALTLTVNKAVSFHLWFHGVRLFGDANGSQYKVEFTIKDENVKLTYTSEQDIDGVWGYDVMLPKPVPIEAGGKFTITATINGPPSHRGQNGKPSVKVDDIVVTFNNAYNLSINATDQSFGQFYKIFLSTQ